MENSTVIIVAVIIVLAAIYSLWTLKRKRPPKRKSVARLAEGQKHGAGLLPPPMSFDHDI